MAAQQATALAALMGKTVTLQEVFMGHSYERTGVVIGVLQGLPGSSCGNEFLLDQGGGKLEFYDPAEVTITRID